MNMTPMIDIVFLLIIFFMTVTQVSKMNKKQLDLPNDLEGIQDQQPAKIIINVDSDGAIEVAGQPRTLPELHAIVTEEVVAAGQDVMKVSVVIRADRNGSSEAVNRIVNLLARDLDMKKIAINVQTGQ